MKAVVLQSNTASPAVDVSVSSAVDIPRVRPGTVLVRVVCAAINPVDNLLALGVTTSAFGWKQPFPYIAGEDFSGVVEAIGDNVTNVKVGDEVFATNWGQGRHDDLVEKDEDLLVGGAFAEYLLIAAHKLSLKPTGISHEQAACIGIPATTAYECLYSHGRVTAESKVLILGLSSAVGQLVAQIAKRHVHCHTVAGTVSQRALPFVQEHLSSDVDVVVCYDRQDWSQVDGDNVINGQRLRDFDVIIDCVGDADALTRARDSGVLKPTGRFVTIANFSIGLDPLAYPPLTFAAAICLCQNTHTQDTIASWIAQGQLSVVIDQTFPFTTEGVQDLYAKIISGKSLGKNILRIQ